MDNQVSIAKDLNLVKNFKTNQIKVYTFKLDTMASLLSPPLNLPINKEIKQWYFAQQRALVTAMYMEVLMDGGKCGRWRSTRRATARSSSHWGGRTRNREYAYPRPVALAVAQVIMAIGQFFFAMGWPGTMYLGTLLVGLGYGSHWAIVPAGCCCLRVIWVEKVWGFIQFPYSSKPCRLFGILRSDCQHYI
ncbi:uncharacterized protein LOC121748296 [Salvia splendens]|uniref:uncharacterized protein LOC121748296 n=1 Tax=Salvia splendens TaxID=180675 RepID=UPI001C26E646|nr:uncharacterized protein LOC121748296 [Salvia splendens]